MPTEFLKEYISLVCRITFQDGMGYQGELLAIDSGWLKMKMGDDETWINSRHVREITALPEKYQEKYRRKQNR